MSAPKIPGEPSYHTHWYTDLLHVHTYDTLPSDVNYRAKPSATAVSNLVWVGLFLWLTLGGARAIYDIFSPTIPPPLPKREETEKNWEVDVTKIISVRMPPSPSPPEAGDTGVIITFYMIICVNLTLEKKLTVSFSTDVIWAIAKVVKAHIRSNPKMKSMLWCIIKKTKLYRPVSFCLSSSIQVGADLP